ncbi:WD40 repeat domain-containing protein [Streptosporangium lutulentum]
MVQSDRAGDTDALVSGLLAATAWNLFPTAEARYGMVDALATSVRSVFPTHGKESDAAAFSPDGKILATAGTGNAVHLWDTATRRRIGRPLTGHTHPIREMRFSPDGKTFATVSQDHSVRLWDTVNRRPVGAPIIPNPTVTDPDGRILTIAFSPDGRAIAVETVDSAIGFWEVSTGRRIDASTAGRPEAFREVPSGFGKAAAPPHSDTVRLWDTTRRQITALAAIEGGAPGLSAFSPDGRTIATVRDNAKEDDTVRLWDAVTRRRIGAPIAVGSGRVHTLAFSPDGRTLAVSGRDKAVRLWDTATGRRVGVTLTGHTDSVTTMNFIRGGRTLATTSGDGTARLWDLTAYRQIGSPWSNGPRPRSA